MKQLLTLFVLLLSLVCCTSEADRTRMRTGLDRINERNRNDQPFAVADVQPYVDFFNQHGTANDQLLACYLLGRAYHDHGEVPMALKYYQQAIDYADTTAKNCDYAQLSRVYGQMAFIFYQQGLYRQMLTYEKYSEKYAWQGNDTLAALMSYEQESQAYRNLNMPDSLLYICEHVSELYRKYGYTRYSAIALFGTFSTLVHRKDFDKARKYMQRYESESGFFDSLGNIQKGREIYYKIKGLYYLYTNVLDSAEYYFRKELCEGKNYSNQNSAANGLALLYNKTHHTDSAAKYAIYAYIMQDSLYAQRATKEVERIQAMYNYTRHQEIAHQESQKATQANISFLISIVVLLIVLLVASWLYIARKKEIECLELTVSELNELREENDALKHDDLANKQQIIENEKRIKQLEKKLGKYGKLVFFGPEKIDNNLKLSPNYQQIKEFAYKGKKLSESDWENIRNLVSEYYPGFHDFLLSNLQINSIDYRICLLLRLHFKTGEIANMLGVTPPYISKTSTNILEYLYGKKGSSKELSKELGKTS